jgi:hypothetical protein
MSSTNRGYDRHKVDFYVTPKRCIREFFSCWLDDLMGEFWDDQLSVGTEPNKAIWLDPCAGGDTTHKMSYPEVIISEFGADVDTIDYRQDSLAYRKEDYLLADVPQSYYDVIITNPPFYLAQEIIEKALRDVKDNGYVVMLLRLNFFGSNERLSFWERQLPVWTYVHHRRFSFTDDGKTDSIEYMHAVWQKNYSPDFTMLKVI